MLRKTDSLWYLVVRKADGASLAVFGHPVAAHRFAAMVSREAGAPAGALLIQPATARTMPALRSRGNVAVPSSWWKILYNAGDALEAAFAVESHARGWHELETQGVCWLRGPGSVLIDAPVPQGPAESPAPVAPPPPPIIGPWYVTSLSRLCLAGPHPLDRRRLLVGPYATWQEAARWLNPCQQAEQMTNPWIDHESYGVEQLPDGTVAPGIYSVYCRTWLTKES